MLTLTAHQQARTGRSSPEGMPQIGSGSPSSLGATGIKSCRCDFTVSAGGPSLERGTQTQAGRVLIPSAGLRKHAGAYYLKDARAPSISPFSRVAADNFDPALHRPNQ